MYKVCIFVHIRDKKHTREIVISAMLNPALPNSRAFGAAAPAD